MPFYSPATVITPTNAPVLGLFTLIFSLPVLAGWIVAIANPGVAYVDQLPIAASAALGFCLGGLALASNRFVSRLWASRLHLICGCLLVTISAISLLNFTGFLAVDALLGLPKRSIDMSPGSLIGFTLAGILLVAVTRLNPLHRGVAIQLGTAAVALIGFLDMLSYAVTMDYLYFSSDFHSLAFVTGLLFVFLALGIWCSWRTATWDTVPKVDILAFDIYRTIDVLVVIIVATVALVSFGLAQGRSEKMMLDQMSIVGKDKRNYFDTVLQAHLDKAVQVSSRPAIVKFMRDYPAMSAADNTVKKTPLVTSAKSFVKHGFSAFSYMDLAGKVLASEGQFVIDPEQRLRLWGKFDIELLWDNGYVMRTLLPIEDETGSAGFIVAEQRLDELTKMHKDAISQGKTGDMVVCALVDGKQDCFPFRWARTAGRYPAYIDGKALPLTRAVTGETATDITTDFRRQRVMASLGPVGTTGLGLAVKRDMVELYEPVRRQFFTALPFLLLLIVGSIWIIRIRVHPLVAALEKSRQDMKAMALHDALTGLPNRTLFTDRLHQAMTRCKRAQTLMAVMYLDLDNFKDINDTQGHQTGDEVLTWFARRLEESVRTSDTVARLAGDEFSVIIESLMSTRDAERIASTILKCMTMFDELFPNLPNGKISTSIGIAFYRGNNISASELLHQADAALYQSKQNGRARYHIATATDPRHDTTNESATSI